MKMQMNNNNNNQNKLENVPSPSNTPENSTALTAEWVRFMDIFPDIPNPIKLFDEKAIARIQAGATPMEAFLIRLYGQMLSICNKQTQNIEEVVRKESKRTAYPGSLQNRHPAPETDPFLEGIKGL